MCRHWHRQGHTVGAHIVGIDDLAAQLQVVEQGDDAGIARIHLGDFQELERLRAHVVDEFLFLAVGDPHEDREENRRHQRAVDGEQPER